MLLLYEVSHLYEASYVTCVFKLYEVIFLFLVKPLNAQLLSNKKHIFNIYSIYFPHLYKKKTMQC